MTTLTQSEPVRYGAPARSLHWLMAGLLAIQISLGLIMVFRGNVLNLWNGLTGVLYSTHKSLGLLLLSLAVVRLLLRLIFATPGAEPSLAPWHRAAAAANHAGLYLLLLVVPLLGWLGASLFAALDVFGTVSLPAIAGPDRAASDT